VSSGGLVQPGQQLGLLEGLADDELKALEQAVREVRLPAGATVFEEGDPGDALYLVRSGLVDVVGRGPAGAAARVVTIGPGETIGEQSLLSGRPRSASAVAQTGVTLWRLDHADFVELLASSPRLGSNVGRIVSERLSAASRARVGLPKGQTVVLCAATSRPIALVAAALTRECRQLLGEAPMVIACGPATVWGRASLPRSTTIHEPDDIAGVAVQAVRDHALVLLLFCTAVPDALLEGADRVIALGEVAGIASQNGHRADVVAESLDGAHIAALARTICGRRVGVALGSGGIRGFVHGGVLEVLTEAGVPIDLVSGASAGAIAGALFLTGMPPRELPDAIRTAVLTSIPSVALTGGSLLTGRRMLTFLRKHVGRETKIEDLPVPFVIATTDVVTREAVHIDSGPLAEAVVASATVPGVFPPVPLVGRRLVDGGTADPVPVSALRARGADIVIAVNIMMMGHGALGAFIQLPRLRFPTPGLLENLFIGLDTVMAQLSAHSCRQADVIVAPTCDEERWYDVMPRRSWSQAGERAMRAALPEVQRLLSPSAPRARDQRTDDLLSPN